MLNYEHLESQWRLTGEFWNVSDFSGRKVDDGYTQRIRQLLPG